KWKILILSCLGFLTAGVLYVLDKPKYSSTAKLLVRYVTERRMPTPKEDDRQIIPLGLGESVISSEMEILNSWDLALQVVDEVHADRILAKFGGGTNRNAAAGTIIGGLKIEVPNKSSVISVSCSHPDPEMAQLILRHLIDSYVKRHGEIHRE